MNSEFDPHAFAMGMVRATRPEFVWSPGCGDQWVEGLRQRVRQAIGAVNEPRPSLEPRHGEPEQRDGYTIQQVDFVSRPGLRVYGYWLEGAPTRVGPNRERKLLDPSRNLGSQGQNKGPVVICVPGHGAGVDALVGLTPEDYQHRFALQCVRHGYRVLAIEPASFGHRKSALERDRDSSCLRDCMAALMLGETMTGWRVRDAMVAVNYLQQRGDVDKIGIMGISGGGLVALWTAALDTRIAATVVSGYFNTFADSILSIDHCPDNFVPGLSKIVEMPDMAALVNPRPLFVESGKDDPIFPVEAFEKACRRAREIYGDAPFGSDAFEGDHFFHGVGAFQFLNQHLTP